MQIILTERGVHDENDKPIAKGTQIEIDGDVLPAKYLNRCRIIEGDKAFVTNPAEDPALDQAIQDRIAEFRTAYQQLTVEELAADGTPKVFAINSKLADGVEAFDSEERNSMWVIIKAENETAA